MKSYTPSGDRILKKSSYSTLSKTGFTDLAETEESVRAASTVPTNNKVLDFIMKQLDGLRCVKFLKLISLC